MSKSVEQTRKEVNDNYPPIEIGQIWEARVENKTLRRVQVIAFMEPEVAPNKHGKWWLLKEKPSEMMHGISYFPCQEFNLRYVFRVVREP